jgi:iron complex transport system permease protein
MATSVAALFAVSLFIGRIMIPPGDVLKILGSGILHLPIEQTWEDSVATAVLRIRLPRAIITAFVGAGLSMSGASFQGMFHNPLVSPFVLGVSAGASLGAALGLVMSAPMIIIQLLAFAFGIIAVLITYSMAHIYKTTPVLMLVLGGMVVSAFFQAMLSLVKFTADAEDKLPAITFWLMGSMGSVGPGDLVLALVPIGAGIVVLFLIRWRLNVFSMGDREARSLGVNTERMKVIIIIATTLITATSVAFCGIIGWVGLVIPHLCRMIVGPDHKRLIPATMLVGAAYLMIIDNICRLVSAAEIPIGILTAVIGAPIFAYLLRKTKGGWN